MRFRVYNNNHYLLLGLSQSSLGFRCRGSIDTHPFKATEKTIININFITPRSFSNGQSDFLLETGPSLHMRPLRQPSFVLKEQSRYLQ